MSMVIKDGTTGFTAQVDDHQRLYVNAVAVSHEQHHATFHKNLFIGIFEATLADGNEANVAFYQNDHSGQDYEFYDIKVSADANIEASVYTGDVYSSGGSAPVITNTNIGSGNTPIKTAYEGGASGNLSLTETARSIKDTVFLSANKPHLFDYKGGLILQTSKSLTVTAKGVAGDKIKVRLFFARHSAGYKL